MTEIPACPAKDLARLFTPEGKADPYPVYASFRDAGPVLRIGPDHLLVAGFDECSQALHDQRLLSTDATVQDLVQPGWSDHASWRWLTKNMLFSNEPQHDRFRRFFSGSLTARQVAAMRPMVERVVSRIVDGLLFLAGDEPVDLMTHVAYGVPMGVMGELLGIRPDAQMSFRDVIGRITLALEPIVDLAVLEPGDRAMDALAAFFADLVDARRREPRDDLVSRWVADRDRTELLSDEELVANLMLLLVAGTEAPMDLVGNTLKLALDHRSEAVDMTTSTAAAAAFVQESLRYDPAVHLLNRVVGRPVTLWGHDLSRGDKVTVAVAAANRDPRCFEEPDRFWPARPDGKALTFSAGPHFCLGSFLARLQTETVVPALLGAFPGIEPAGPPTFRDQLVQRGFATVPVRLGTPSRARASLTAIQPEQEE